MRIAIASDHRGVGTKSHLVKVLTDAGHEMLELGPSDDARVDYPDFANAVARRVSSVDVDRGILICGTGIGMAISANKSRGIRAAVAHDERTARICRQHNDANVLCLSGDWVDNATNAIIAKAWLSTDFEGGRHARRIAKISDLEKR